ncbi:hypothetical protein l11_13210 [Neisseria weaveri LMG 5135]|nr:hypothetical protein l11_13210 [Neisseria weaveri LMG 5135]
MRYVFMVLIFMWFFKASPLIAVIKGMNEMAANITDNFVNEV